MCITSLIIQLHLTTPPTPTLPSNKRLIPVPRGSLCLLKPYLSPICRYPMPKSAIKPASIIAQGTSVWLLCHKILLSRFTISDLKSREKIWNCIWSILNVIGILWPSLAKTLWCNIYVWSWSIKQNHLKIRQLDCCCFSAQTLRRFYLCREINDYLEYN